MEFLKRTERLRYVIDHNENFRDMNRDELSSAIRKMLYSPFIFGLSSFLIMFIGAKKKNFKLSGASPLVQEVKTTYSIILASFIIGMTPSVYFFYKFSEKLDEFVSIGGRNGWISDEEYRMVEDHDFFLSKADISKENEEILGDYLKKVMNKGK